MASRAEILKQKFQTSVALPVEQVLPEEVIQTVLDEQGIKYRHTLYTPIVVLWATISRYKADSPLQNSYLWSLDNPIKEGCPLCTRIHLGAWVCQVLDGDKSLSNAVKRVTAWLAAEGETAPSGDTGAYSKARKRLPLAVLKSLLPRTAVALTSQVKPEQWWCGRRVKAYDGTSVLMSDTPANQEAYPQHSNQKAGCGFPLAKVVVWFCGTTGAVLEVAIAAFNTSEWQLSRQLYAKLDPEDVVVADSAYGTYADLALIRLAKADAVFRTPSCSAV